MIMNHDGLDTRSFTAYHGLKAFSTSGHAKQIDCPEHSSIRNHASMNEAETAPDASGADTLHHEDQQYHPYDDRHHGSGRSHDPQSFDSRRHRYGQA